jgi:NADH-quinone oxidoreductase subunit K
MQPVSLEHYLIVSFILFMLGMLGVVRNRKSILISLMAIELMLLAININLIAFSYFLHDLVGQLYALLVLSVAAAESAIGLAILVVFYRNRCSVSIQDLSEMKG